jgi:hypothetical protein
MRALAVGIAVVSLAPVPVAGQAQTAVAKSTAGPKAWTPPRTPDGQPDLQGVWDYRTITPLERPIALGERQFFTDEEAANFEKEENRRQNRDLIDPGKGGAQYPPGGVVPYNEFWYDRGSKITASKRTSLIVDPPDGRLPPRTPEGQKRAAARAAVQREDQLGRAQTNSYEDRSLQERCIVGFNSGPPMTPGAYNNNFQLFQNAGYVVILNEMVHQARLVPLHGRPHGTIRQWHGDPRGRWEGDTLVVDTTQFYRETSLAGSSASMRLVERFTRVDADTLLYEFTVDNPSTWTKPWTAQIPMKKSQDQMYEYACHEGNYGMLNMLEGARAQEKAAEEAGKKGSR